MAQNYVYPSSSTVTLTGTPNGTPIPSTSILIGGKDGSGNQTPISTDSSGNVNVNVVDSQLPAGAATEAKQDVGNASLASIDTSSASTVSALATANTTLSSLNARSAGSLVPTAFDNIALTYVAAGNGVGQVETAVYKLGATTVATLTLVYDVSNNLSSVTKS